MADSRATERARIELEKRLVELSGLRNAGTRDSGFKLWRQTTLTLLQLTWEGDDSRAAQFRRIPFSPPSAKSDREELRSWYERGCGEAASLLRELIDEVVENGIVATARPDPEDEGEALDALPEDGSPILTLGEDPPPPKSESKSSATIARLPQPPAAAPPRAAAAPRKGEPPPAQRPGKPCKSSKRPGLKMRLKDMLGFNDQTEPPAAEEAPRPAVRSTHHPRSAEPAPNAPPRAHADVPAVPARPADTALPVTRGAAALPSESAPPEFQMPPDDVDETAHLAPREQLEDEDENDRPNLIDEGTLQRALEAALHSFVQREPDPQSQIADLLNRSPVFDASARPKRRAAAGETMYKSATAIAVAGIANEVAAFGVPDRYRAIARAAMLDLAGHLDRRDLTWQTLREAIHFVMEYPVLARRILPLLLPYLDQAA